METINKHVSIRKFLDKSIEQKLLESILYSGTRASTTGNMQLYSIIISESEEQKKKQLPLHFNQALVKNAPVLLTFVADFNRFSKWCELNNAKPGYSNFLSFFTAAIDTLLVAQNVCIAAENQGLGICYLGTTTYNAREIIEVLNLPKLTFPVTTIAIGYPDESPELNDRLPLNGIIHSEKYNDYTESQIQKLYSFKENLETSKTFVEENNKETLAQVFTDVRYKETDNQFFSGKMLKTIKDQGFLE
ncbi:MAG: NADPH-dependent oxidoreductase [Prolixibacteraceae bacterium]|jgi:nitroreductase|nr:NADPH-dependent oxidoreductase [Prolixibacteraceae bacterium]MBT6007109.1 NADPH-dependent oxidoreductase [Prolixibacteraceae bacterium]MBT6766858.1 NADPH-dependent oxidoreductase [Prolixibacteraceae bacterium]MBT7000670.1 NADPH-dependent oxidoreductase [Prolixibacteraceae bacterium]MBT7397358.1 NADPH-dependent oxidoreductase [Prolixibacteraceae bacterium]